MRLHAQYTDQKQHQEVLDHWLEERGTESGPIFLTQSGKRLDRTQAFVILKRVARQANAPLPPAQHIEVSPHVLRHTLLRKVANEKGVHYAMELSGHRSDRYIAQESVAAANRLIDTIVETCHQVAAQPERGRLRPELAPNLRSYPVGNYVIFYRPTQDGIEVALVLHGARDIDALFQ